jgi:hypothetical protein
VPQGNRVNKQKFNAKAPRRPRTAKTACMHSYWGTLLAAISHPNRQPVVNLESWRFFFASSRLGVAPLVSRTGLAGGGAPNKDSYRRSFFMAVGMSHPISLGSTRISRACNTLARVAAVDRTAKTRKQRRGWLAPARHGAK